MPLGREWNAACREARRIKGLRPDEVLAQVARTVSTDAAAVKASSVGTVQAAVHRWLETSVAQRRPRTEALVRARATRYFVRLKPRRVPVGDPAVLAELRSHVGRIVPLSRLRRDKETGEWGQRPVGPNWFGAKVRRPRASPQGDSRIIPQPAPFCKGPTHGCL